MRALGDAGDEKLAFEIGRLLAREVRAAGFDFDFAPVLDVDTNPANPVIGDRSFSRHPQDVARLGVALARGLESEGVASCGKHFPGHGDTSQDSHKTLPRLPHGLQRLQEIELVPFRAYCVAGLASLMTAHVVPAFAGGGLGRMLIQGVARDLTKRGVRAIEAFGDAKFGESGDEAGGCVAPADFFLSVGFKTVRPHPRYPRLRLELRTALSWKSDVEYALEKLLGSMSPETLLRPVRPATRSSTPV